MDDRLPDHAPQDRSATRRRTRTAVTVLLAFVALLIPSAAGTAFAAAPEAVRAADAAVNAVAVARTSDGSLPEAPSADESADAPLDTPAEAPADTPAAEPQDEQQPMVPLPPAGDASTPADDAGTEQPTTEQPGTEQPGTEQPGTEQPGTEQPGTEQPGTEQPGTEQPPAETPVDPAPPADPAPAEPLPADPAPADPAPETEDDAPVEERTSARDSRPAPAETKPADTAPKPSGSGTLRASVVDTPQTQPQAPAASAPATTVADAAAVPATIAPIATPTVPMPGSRADPAVRDASAAAARDAATKRIVHKALVELGIVPANPADAADPSSTGPAASIICAPSVVAAATPSPVADAARVAVVKAERRQRSADAPSTVRGPPVSPFDSPSSPLNSSAAAAAGNGSVAGISFFAILVGSVSAQLAQAETVAPPCSFASNSATPTSDDSARAPPAL